MGRDLELTSQRQLKRVISSAKLDTKVVRSTLTLTSTLLRRLREVTG